MTICDYMELSGNIWEYLSLSGTSWDSLGLSGSIWEYLGLAGTIWDYMGLSGTISNYLKLFRTLVQVEAGESKLMLFQNLFVLFLGARAPLGIARLKKRMKKFRNSNNLLSPASTCTPVRNSPR